MIDMRRLSIPAAIAAFSLVAACSSGEPAITAGNDDAPEPAETSAPADDAADTDTDDSADSSDAETTTDDTDDTEVAETAPPTTVSPLSELPACPTEALAAADGPVELTYWHGLNATNEEALNTLAESYNASQDQVVVSIENQGSYLEALDKFYQSGDSARPDMIMFPEFGFQQAIDSGVFVPVDACIESSAYDTSPILPVALDAYTQSGVQWGMPFNVSNALLFFDRNLFVDAGLDPDDPPSSFEELRAASEAIIATGGATYGVALDTNIDGGGGWFLEQWFANGDELYANNGNGRDAPATEILIDGEYGVRLLTELQELEADGIIVNVGDNASTVDGFLKLADESEPAAMTIGSSASLGPVLSVLGGGQIEGVGPDDIGVGPLPSFSGEQSAIIGGAANFIVDGHGDEVTAAAWDFATYIITAESQSIWSEATGYVPIAAGAVDLEPLASVYDNDPRFRVAFDQLAASPIDAEHAGPVIGPHRQIRSATASALASIWDGADVQTTLTEAAAAAKAMLEQWALLNG